MFKKGDKVVVKHDKGLGICTVSNPKEKTDMTILTLDDGGNTVHVPVNFYVRIDAPNGKTGLGYHASSLEKV
jgi:hypothetical protein